MYDWDKDVPAGDFLGEIVTYWQKDGGVIDICVTERYDVISDTVYVRERKRESHLMQWLTYSTCCQWIYKLSVQACHWGQPEN